MTTIGSVLPSAWTSEVPAAANPTEPPLSQLLAHRRWWWHRDPFPHVIGRDVFVPSVYQSIAAAFREHLDQGLDGRPGPEPFGHPASRDTYALPFEPELSDALSVFVSRSFHDMIAGILGIAATGDMHGGLHYHRPGGPTGEIHNDLNPGWFVDSPRSDGINISSSQLCSYRYGPDGEAQASARQTVRAATVLFYLNNAEWSPEDGGETGLHSHRSDEPDKPAATVPPINNSLLAFECTPWSFHNFIQNLRRPRSSVIVWLHRPKSDAVSRWGERNLVPWPPQRPSHG